MLKMTSNLFMSATLHQSLSRWFFNWIFTCVIRVIWWIVSLFASRNFIDFDKIIMRNLWCLTKLKLTNSITKTFVSIIKETLRTLLIVYILIMKFNCRSLTKKTMFVWKKKKNIVTRCESTTWLFDWLIRFCVFLRSFWVRFFSKIINFSSDDRDVVQFLLLMYRFLNRFRTLRFFFHFTQCSKQLIESWFAL